MGTPIKSEWPFLIFFVLLAGLGFGLHSVSAENKKDIWQFYSPVFTILPGPNTDAYYDIDGWGGLRD